MYGILDTLGSGSESDGVKKMQSILHPENPLLKYATLLTTLPPCVAVLKGRP
jgi:hypothetical protein